MYIYGRHKRNFRYKDGFFNCLAGIVGFVVFVDEADCRDGQLGGGVSRKHAFFVSCFGSEKVMYGLMLPPATRAVGRPLHQLDSIASIAWDL